MTPHPNGHPTAFTFSSLEQQLRDARAAGYEFMTCADYVRRKGRDLPPLGVVLRVDVDVSVKRARRLGEVFAAADVRGTFFIRLHAHEYNPLSFEHYAIIKGLIAAGHELGYHSEIVDQAAIWNEDPATCLRRDLNVLSAAFDTPVRGIASHGGGTGLNNLDFWKTHRPQEFGLLYEAYDHEPTFNLFQEAFYISDSEWTRWKCYDRGRLVEGDRRTLGEHLADRHPLIYLLIHSDTYFDRHFYE